jgi:hypothetical protein
VRTLVAAAGVAGLLAVLALATLPPKPRPTGPAAPDPARSLDGTPREPLHVAAGAIHVHTVRSDGTGTADEVAAAAARAGLAFVVFTDHGDGTRDPLPPQYRSGVLCVDALEISTEGGHLVALGLARTPYRLAGEPRDVLEDVHRFGGFGVAAHPDSSKGELAWRDWSLPIDGVEWFNLDTEWRDEGPGRLLLALLHQGVRPAPALGALVRPDRPVLARWDRLARTRRVVGLAAVDAHARIGADAAPGGSLRLRVPSYEASFRTARVAVELAAPFSGDAWRDMNTLLAALRRARSYGWIEAFAPAGRVEFTGHRPDGTAIGIGEFAGHGLEGVRLRAAAAAPPDAEIRLICDGMVVASGPAPGPVLRVIPAPPPEACRAEVRIRRGNGFEPWLVTNHIYGRAGDPSPAQTTSAASATMPIEGAGVADWVVEHDASSEAHVETRTADGASEVRLRYRLAAGARRGQYAALAGSFSVPGDAAAIHLTAAADRPMRLSLQLRQPDGGGGGRRWRRSIYVDAIPRAIVVPIADLRPADPGQDDRPSLARVHAVLVVVDTTNTPPGQGGLVAVRDVTFGRAAGAR